MKKYIIHGGKKLNGNIRLTGSKNIVLKALVAACLTSEEVELTNIPSISDFFVMLDLIKHIGGKVTLGEDSVKIKLENINSDRIPLDIGAKIRTSSMFLSPLLARNKSAIIPNPGGCRIGARPIERHIEGLQDMGVSVKYNSEDGYFYAQTGKLKGTHYTFEKNTHTGTETLILAAVLADGKTVLDNAAQEPEIDDLIDLLCKMGADVKRVKPRTIEIEGVKELHGASHRIMSDRNELVTFAVMSGLTGGSIHIQNADLPTASEFMEKFKRAGGDWVISDNGIRFFIDGEIKPSDIITLPHPGFMTDWQGPWAIFMTQASGISTIHETIYENRFGYVDELRKMGAKIEYFDPQIKNAVHFYNFNYQNLNGFNKHAIKITGKTDLHNAVLNISDLRAGATLVIAALIAKGESVIYGIEHLERGYEKFPERLSGVGAEIIVDED